MTKSEYSEYLASDHWKTLRLITLQNCPLCNRCALPRWLAEIAYDQDLHVHHLTYARLGHEDRDDLEVLCRRCHEIETFGRSSLSAVRSHPCDKCGDTMWDMRAELCDYCMGFECGSESLEISAEGIF